MQRQLVLYRQTLAQRIDRYRTLPEVLALDDQLRDALHHPLSAAQTEQLNRKLEQANGASNVGMDYSFRPYVQQALTQGSGSFYGIGVTTGEPRYFLSQAIHDDNGQTVGLVAIKIARQELEREWLQTPDTVLASDAHGVVFLASQDAWRYRVLEPLDDAERRELRDTRRYSAQPLRPLDYRVDDQMDDGGRLVRVLAPDLPALQGRVLWQTQPLPGTPWQLHLLHDTRSSVSDSRWAAAAGAGGCLALSLLVLFVRQRQRLATLRQRSRQELETVLQQHAADDTMAQRLSHLRSGTPHLHESAKGDGTVLEIRGNPLPDGSFVTSSSDITSYKNAARELRLLADALEQRVADRTRDVALGPMLQVLAHHFGVLAESRGLALSCVDTRCVVRTDDNLLRRILQNFVSNAIRYSRRGRIVVGCRRESGPGGDHVRIEVHDQGPGIPEALQREIFEEFRCLDEGGDGDRGAGLGLAIVERLGCLLGHEIGLRSQLGKGSVFWVRVPLGDPAAAQQIAPPASTPEQAHDAPLDGASAWVIEDDGPTCAATQALLQRWGCAVPLAGGAAQALAQAQPGQAPQLVLLDVHLGPGHHSPDVYAELCQRWGKTPAVILVTAERDATLRRQAAERGWGVSGQTGAGSCAARADEPDFAAPARKCARLKEACDVERIAQRRQPSRHRITIK